MAGAPGADAALAIASRRPSLPVGMHGVLVEAKSILSRADTPLLVDETGDFRKDKLRSSVESFSGPRCGVRLRLKSKLVEAAASANGSAAARRRGKRGVGIAVEMALLPVANPKLQSKRERSPEKSTAKAQIESLDQHQSNRRGGGTTRQQAGEDRRNDLERAIRRISETTATVPRPFTTAAVGRSPIRAKKKPWVTGHDALKASANFSIGAFIASKVASLSRTQSPSARNYASARADRDRLPRSQERLCAQEVVGNLSDALFGKNKSPLCTSKGPHRAAEPSASCR
jgi:hypothetical protein